MSGRLRKRKREGPSGPVEIETTGSVTFFLSSFPMLTCRSIACQSKSACGHCKQKKLKCEYIDNADSCRWCTDNGHEDTCEPTTQKSTSSKSIQKPIKKKSVAYLHPLEKQSNALQGKGPESRLPPATHNRSHSQGSVRSRASASRNDKAAPPIKVIPPLQKQLPTIIEDTPEDDSLETRNDVPDETINRFAEFISARSLELGPSQEEVVSGSDIEDEYGTEEEDLYMEADSWNDNGGHISFSEETGEIHEYLKKNPVILPQQAKKKTGPKPKQWPAPQTIDEYNPLTCRT